MVHDRHAARGGELLSQRHQCCQEYYGYIRRGRHLQHLGDHRRPRRTVDNECGDCDRQPDLYEYLGQPAELALGSGALQQFTATANDQFGAAMASQPMFTWALASGVGGIDNSSGLYTAPYAPVQRPSRLQAAM